MAFVTQIPSGVVQLDGDLLVLNTNQVSALNNFTGSSEVNGDITATNEGGDGDIAEPGETITVPTENGEFQGVYVGPANFSTTNVPIGLPPLVGLNLVLNDINGQVFQDEDGNTYLITDEPISEGRLGATLSVQVAGQTISVDAPVSEIAGELTDAVNAAGQTAFNAAFTPAYNTAFAAGFLLPLEARIAAATLAGNTAGETARLPFSTVAGTLGGLETALQSALDTVVFTVAPGQGDLAVVCFTRGTLIMTSRGPVAIEALAVGDEVLTKGNGLQPIRWIGSVKLGKRALDQAPNLQPVRIKAGALGASIPATDLVVSPQHRVLVRSKVAQRMFGTSEILVAAKQLLQVDGVDIAHDLHEVEYHHFLFEQHEVVIANGAETESLFTGPEAMKSVGPAARKEIALLFPQLTRDDYEAVSAMTIASGRMARKLAVRHIQNRQPLVC